MIFLDFYMCGKPNPVQPHPHSPKLLLRPPVKNAFCRVFE